MAATSGFDSRDPIQGYDVEVYSTSHGGLTATDASQLQGIFTSLMFKVVNQTETYLPLNSRIPRHLDGEIIFVWAAEQGMVTPDFMKQTFGQAFANGVALGRGYKIPRSNRFKLTFRVNTGTTAAQADPSIFDNNAFPSDTSMKAFSLEYCRVDTYSFGVTSGRHVVANSWQGTAEKLLEINERVATAAVTPPATP